MKIKISPKTCMFGLIIVFLIVNSVFFYIFVTGEDQDEDNFKFENKTELLTPEFLKEYVNFNETSYINDDGRISFYYGVRNRWRNYDEAVESEKNLEGNGGKKICQAFLDQEYSMMLDSNFSICKIDDFDVHTNCCQRNYNNYTEICNNESECCKAEFICIKKCINPSNTPGIHHTTFFSKCEKVCAISPLTEKSDYKYCYYQDKLQIDYHITEIDESCEEVCEKQNKKCYRHILFHINNPGFLNSTKVCTEIIRNDSTYGPAANTSTNSTCYYSDKFSISCKQKFKELKRFCTCV